MPTRHPLELRFKVTLESLNKLFRSFRGKNVKNVETFVYCLYTEFTVTLRNHES